MTIRFAVRECNEWLGTLTSLNTMEQITTMDYAGDFRSEALLASARFCNNASIQASPHDLTQLGVSLCLPASDDPRAEIHAVRRALIKGYLIMVTLLLCGVAMLVAANTGLWNTAIGWWMGAILVLAGWAMMCSSVSREHWIARRRIEARGSGHSPFPVSENLPIFRIEDPATFKTIKLVIDDVAIGWCDTTRNVLQLEGFAYRYVIWAKDIHSMNRLGDRFVEVKFYVGGSTQLLSLAVAMNGAAIELKRQLSFGRATRAVEAPLMRVFGLPVSWQTA